MEYPTSLPPQGAPKSSGMCYDLLTMGRPRTLYFDLPPRMRQKGNALYYVGADKRWIPLGSDLAKARLLWARYEDVASSHSMAELVDTYIATKMAKNAPNTVRQYRSYANTVRKLWGTLECSTLTTPQIARWRDLSGIGPATANGVIALLRVAFPAAIEWGWCVHNPALSASKCETEPRPDYLEDGPFKAIRLAAPAWLKVAMNLAYNTALRPIDILALRWEWIGNGTGNGLVVLPRKTQRTRVSVDFVITPEVQEALDDARRRPIVGLFVVANDRGRPITYNRLNETWRELVNKLGFAGTQFRDIRSKSATDADAQGQDAGQLLHHHKGPGKTTQGYLKKGTKIVVEPLRRKL